MTSAFHQGDISAILGAYEAGAVVVGEPGKPVQGEAALREMFAGYIAVKPQFVYSGHEVIVAGDLALHLAPWRMTGMAPDGSAIQQRGLSVAVLRRQPDDSWLMVIDQPFGDALVERAVSDANAAQ
jgi:uncharacterized protein (TIGR02246 family)